MKKCPTCEKTFDDSMRFCQTDGTPLIDDVAAAEAEPAFDPYATIVSSAPLVEEPAAEEVVAEVAAPEPVAEAAAEEPSAEPEPEPEVAADEPVDDGTLHQTVGSVPIAPPEDVLDLPSNDPLKTMYVSETEMQEALGGAVSEPDIVDLPPFEETPAPEPPSFIAPDVPAAAAPPPSPFSAPEPVIEEIVPEPEPEVSSFDEAATIMQPTFEPPPSPAFDPPPPPAPVAEWAPPPAPDAAWQNQEIGSNTPFQPPPAGAGAAGENKTLAIVSLVTGILSVLCCSSIFVVGLAAIVIGFIAKSKADSNPNEFGGKGLAWGGIITGGVSMLFGVLYWILVIFQVVALPNF